MPSKTNSFSLSPFANPKTKVILEPLNFRPESSLTLPFQEPANYQFKYEVKDEYSGQDFGAEEARSGYNTDGEYTVLLPDGRKQIVTYKVSDEESGFVADVRYEGEAREYDYKPNYNPKPVYKPAPAPYKPAPVAYQPEPSYVKPVYTPRPTYKPVYKPEPTYKPVYKPEPTYAPVVTTTYASRPAYPRQPVYTTVAPSPKPVYTPRPAYRPVARTYKPEPEPVYKTSVAPSYSTPSPKARQYSTTAAPAYNAAAATAESNEVSDAPTYNPAQTTKRRMRLPKKLKAGRSRLRTADDGLFYGSVKGRVRIPTRRRATAEDLSRIAAE